MKAIHNNEYEIPQKVVVGNYKLKYNFESNSQLIGRINQTTNGWEL
nr:hypothetical protein [Flavobacterium franklandianum]